MDKVIMDLCERCKDALETAARTSYNNGDNPDWFDGCHTIIDLAGEAQIECTVDRKGNHEVLIYHESNNETPNLEKAIADWLDDNVDEEAEWQDEYDHDDWRDVDPGCDPAFPHYGEFERWAYGR
ncbi:MAG: hypothetical protein PUF32_05640 [Prevotella sp.]|nr:hypothetical protein [Prevotella sp.]